MKLLLTFAAAASFAFGACTLSTDGIPQIGWESYKTPAKIGVRGGFAKVSVEGMAEATTLPALLEGGRVVITEASVDSKNPGRDATLVQFFFDQMKAETIEAEITAVKGDETSGVATVTILMNGVSREVPMRYSATKEEVTAEGFLDLADFSALGALKSINKACYDHHQGKTWQDIAIRFTLPLTRSCE